MASAPEKLQAFLGKAIGDFGAAVSARETARGNGDPTDLIDRSQR